VTLAPRRVAQFGAIAIGVLVVGHGFAILFEHVIGHDRAPGTGLAFRMLYMDLELNAATWFTSATLVLCAVLAVLVGALGPEPHAYRPHWYGLAGVLVFLSLDDGAVLHEDLSRPLTRGLDLEAGDWEFWAWLLPYGAFAVLFATVYARFLSRQPTRTRNLLLAAGATYVLGAAGFELLGRELWDDADPLKVSYMVLTGVEETLEMAAIVILGYALTAHLRDRVGTALVRFGPPVVALAEAERAAPPAPVHDEVSTASPV
jgi:hypothetical protein